MIPVENKLDLLILAACLALASAAITLAYLKRGMLKNCVREIGESFPEKPSPDAYITWRLFWVSFVALYIEIMMIRWIGTEVRVFAYFQNLALIACFLGFGLGCYWSSRRKSMIFTLLAITALAILAETPVRQWQSFLAALSSRLSLFSDAAMWGFMQDVKGLTTWVLLFAASVIGVATLLLLLVILMIPLGQWVGFYLDRASNPIRAYSANLLGSIAGIWIFAGMAFLWLRPSYWFVLAIAFLWLASRSTLRFTVASLIAALGLVTLFHFSEPAGSVTVWSPYQKLELVPLGDNQYHIRVNNTGYMGIANMTPAFLSRHPGIAANYRASSYDSPFRFAQSTDRVLIVGAGAGNDTAAALRNGAKQVDAVEIDPVILSLGRRLHPEKPYDSPSVHLVLNDARAFLRHNREKYDFILFALLDSHTQFSDYSNMRIDNYVYTEEAFQQARALLKPDGIMVVKFEVRDPWLWMGQRFNGMLTNVFGRPPIVYYAGKLGMALTSATVFIESDGSSLWNRASSGELAAIVAKNPPEFSVGAKDVPPTTDDWPYIYHRSHSIPRTYLTISLILLAIALLLVRGTFEPQKVSSWHFFLLGAGFLLLETQMISRLALYFGTTWLVNCVALTAILVVLVLANFYVSWVRPRRLQPYFVLLLVFLAGSYFFPWEMLTYGAKTVGVLLSVAYSLPVFFAGVIFTESFRRYSGKSAAFGANIVGAVAGGLAQNLSFIVGMRALLIVAAMLYAVAGLCALREQGEEMRAALIKPTAI